MAGLALLVRCAWVVLQGLPSPETGLLFPDEREYWRLAESIAAGRGLVDEFGYRATFMPLYPAFLSLFVDHPHALLAARLAQAAAGAVAVVPVFLLGNRLGGRRAATVAAILVALDPFLVFGFSHRMLTETLFTSFFCLAIWAGWPPWKASRWYIVRACAAGALFAGCLYLRPSAATFLAVWAVAIVSVTTDRRSGMVFACISVAVAVLCLLPWAARNREVLGTWRWLTTRSGISLYDGLGPRATGASDLAYTKTMPNVRGMSETQWDDYFARESLRIARDDPQWALRLAGAKLRRMWSLVPNEPGSRTPLKMGISAVWMSVALALVVVGAVRAPTRGAVLLLLLPAIWFTLVHMVFVGSVRYRVPVMPVAYVLVGIACRGATTRRADASGAEAGD